MAKKTTLNKKLREIVLKFAHAVREQGIPMDELEENYNADETSTNRIHRRVFHLL